MDQQHPCLNNLSAAPQDIQVPEVSLHAPSSFGHFIYLYSITYIKEDIQLYDADGLEIALRSGDFLLRLPRASLFGKDSAHNACVSICFSSQFFYTYIIAQLADNPVFMDCFSLLELQTQPYRIIHTHDEPYWSGLMDSIIAESQALDEYSLRILGSQILILLAQLARAYTSNRSKLQSLKHNTEDVISYIGSNCLSVTLQQTADHFHYTTAYLSHVLSTKTGRCFIDWVHYFRLHYSLSMLEKSNLPITAIATACGYNNSNYYCRTFSKFFGMSPTQYRKKHQFQDSNTAP